MSNADQREVLTWQDFGPAANELAALVAADGFRPDVLLCVARGGLLVGGALSYPLDVKNTHLVNVFYYTGVDTRLEAPVLLDPAPDPAALTGMKVLIADDVADTGGTLELVRDLCLAHAADVRSAVLYEKPQSTVTCEYVWRRTDRWITFPWSAGIDNG